MSIAKNDVNGKDLGKEIEEMRALMHEQLRQYSFQNDHIMRGPLCRAVGLIDLLKRERLEPELRKMLDMLLYELRQIENITFMISKILEDHEEQLENKLK